MRYINEVKCLEFYNGLGRDDTRFGLFYVSLFGFSLNEGRFPNFHISWRTPSCMFRGLYIYMALSKKWKWTLDRTRKCSG